MSLGAEDLLYAPELDHVTTRKRYYNTTYNSRHGKRRNLNASSYIKQVEEAARQREKVCLSYPHDGCSQFVAVVRGRSRSVRFKFSYKF
jgi:hypothetical protein